MSAIDMVQTQRAINKPDITLMGMGGAIEGCNTGRDMI